MHTFTVLCKHLLQSFTATDSSTTLMQISLQNSHINFAMQKTTNTFIGMSSYSVLATKAKILDKTLCAYVATAITKYFPKRICHYISYPLMTACFHTWYWHHILDGWLIPALHIYVNQLPICINISTCKLFYSCLS